jgi:hypothetical protein
VKNAASIPAGARSAIRAASSMAGGCAVAQFVLNGSVRSWAPAASAISSPYE